MSKKLLSVFMAVIMMFCVISTLPVGAEGVENQETNTQSSMGKVGDTDKNGEVNIKDVTLVQKAVNDATLSLDTSLSDVNDDGDINVKDAAAIQKYLNKTVRNFPKEVDYDWRTSSIGYEIFVRSFYDSNGDGCGDFNGITEKIDYLKSLNVGVVWLTPINKSDSYHGYDVIDYKAVNEDFGTMEDFNNMLNAFHENGIKVILDLVVNHTSNQHQWFKDARYNRGDYRDFYVWSENPSVTEKDYWTYDAVASGYAGKSLRYYSCFNGNMPDLNYNNPKVLTAIDDVADFWLDKGVDGFRLDAAMHIDDCLTSDGKHDDSKEDTVTHKWWQHFENHVKEKNPDAFCVGEVWPEVSMQTNQAKFFGDLDSDFDFFYMAEMKSMAKGTKKMLGRFISGYMSQIYDFADKTPDVPKVTINSTMLDNHDVNRMAYEFYTSTKDQIKSTATERLKLVANIQMTSAGMPWIYYGDEIGQSGGGSSGSADPNRREAMDWYTDRTGTGATKMNAIRSWSSNERFTKAGDGISVEEQDGVDGSLLEHYRKLTEIRNKYKIFYTGEYSSSIYVGDLVAYTVTDQCRDYSMFVLHNNKTTDLTLTAQCDFTDELTGKTYKKGDTYTLKALTSLIAKYTDTVPVAE